MSPTEIAQINAQLCGLSAPEILNWAVSYSQEDLVLSTNFKPYSAVMLDICVKVWPMTRIIWVDHGFNKPETYRFAEKLKGRLGLMNFHTFHPRMSAAYYTAVHGEPPTVLEEEKLKEFTRTMKLLPFEKAMQKLAPKVWLTGRRQTESPGRANLPRASFDDKFNVLKINPIVDWTDEDMDAYLEQHDLPNEPVYYDVTKGDAHRECGLHMPENLGANI